MEGIVLWPKAVSPGKMFLIPLCIADAEPVIYHWNLQNLTDRSADFQCRVVASPSQGTAATGDGYQGFD